MCVSVCQRMLCVCVCEKGEAGSHIYYNSSSKQTKINKKNQPTSKLFMISHVIELQENVVLAKVLILTLDEE